MNPPETQGRHVLLKIGKKFNSRRLRDALKKGLRTNLWNSEERLPVIEIMIQLEAHIEESKKKANPLEAP